jgi:hypothetical protein
MGNILVVFSLRFGNAFLATLETDSALLARLNTEKNGSAAAPARAM